MSNKPAIVVITYNRPIALQRLLDSIAGANYPERDVTLVISIDSSGSEKILKIAESFVWEFGTKRIICHENHLGLKQHVLSCGDLTNEFGTVIILEDDLFVSPYFYQYAFGAEKFYSDDQNIAGISLYNYQVAESCFCPFQAVDDGSDVYFIQVASSWGQLFTKQQWSSFREWFSNNPELSVDNKIPEYLHQWGKNSWKKHFIHYLIETNKYFVFPRLSLTTNFEETGTNSASKNVYQVNLQMTVKSYLFKSLSESKCKYDAWFEAKPELFGSLKKYNFEVDLYGIKPLKDENCDYVLTSKLSEGAELSFSDALKPQALNVILNNKGKGIGLYHKKSKTFLEPVYKPLSVLEASKPKEIYDFSIIVKLDNGTEPLFLKTIESVKIQNYPLCEIIVIGKSTHQKKVDDLLHSFPFKFCFVQQENEENWNLNLAFVDSQNIMCILNEGDCLEPEALKKINLIFQTYRHINWLSGLSKEFVNSKRYDLLNANEFRLIPDDVRKQVRKGKVNCDLTNHFFRKPDKLLNLASESNTFLQLISNYQMVLVLDAFVARSKQSNRKELTPDVQKEWLGQLHKNRLKLTIQVKILYFLIKLPVFGEKTARKWFLMAAKNYPDVLRFDPLNKRYYLNKF